MQQITLFYIQLLRIGALCVHIRYKGLDVNICTVHVRLKDAYKHMLCSDPFCNVAADVLVRFNFLMWIEFEFCSVLCECIEKENNVFSFGVMPTSQSVEYCEYRGYLHMK